MAGSVSALWLVGRRCRAAGFFCGVVPVVRPVNAMVRAGDENLIVVQINRVAPAQSPAGQWPGP